MNNAKRQFVFTPTIYLVFMAFLSIAIVLFLQSLRIFPISAEAETFDHLFKVNYLYESIKNGTLYPVYTPYWYNSMELFRHLPALSYYVGALCEWAFGGSAIEGVYLFTGICFVLTMLGWYFLGRLENRSCFSFLLGILYFLSPDSIRVYFGEGNLPRVFVNALIPLFIYFLWKFLKYNCDSELFWIAIMFVVMICSQFSMALVVFICTFVFAMIYCMVHGGSKKLILLTMDFVFATLACGILLVPGIDFSDFTTEKAEMNVGKFSEWLKAAVEAINPIVRFREPFVFYFGFVAFLILIVGLFIANKEVLPTLITAFLIYLSTTPSVSTIYKMLPVNEVFWMQRLVPMAMIFIFLTILIWKKLKKKVLVFLSILLAVDSLLSLSVCTGRVEDDIPTILENRMDNYLIDEAINITSNRLGILDNSALGAMPGYYITGGNVYRDRVNYTFGWDVSGADIKNDIVCINEAKDLGFYPYAFDRLLEIGDDTVIVYKEKIPEEGIDEMLSSARRIGYRLVDENDYVWLFKYPVYSEYGTIKDYKSYAIGSSARMICYLYPNIGYGTSFNIEDYSVDELAKYDKLFLSGFTYYEKENAEKLLDEVANLGVKVYIDMQEIPVNLLTGKNEFMGVYAQYISFTQKFPVLTMHDGNQFKLDPCTDGYSTWNTVYLAGMSEVLNSAFYDNRTDLAYIARNGNDNIYFLGLNTVYYYVETGHEELIGFINELFDEEQSQTVETKIVPIKAVYEPDRLTIISTEDKVNTNIANLECFVKTKGTKAVNGSFLEAERGTNEYKVKYSRFKEGIITSIVGVFMGFLFLARFAWKRERSKRMKSNIRAALLALIAILFVLSANIQAEAKKKVPDMAGKTVEYVTNWFKNNKMTDYLVWKYEYSDTVEKDIVIRSYLCDDSRTEVVVSLGAEPNESLDDDTENGDDDSDITGGFSANSDANPITIDGTYTDWDGLPSSYEFNYDNSEQCWYWGYWLNGANYTTPVDTYDTNVRHKMQLYCDGDYAYIHIVFATNYYAKTCSEGYQFYLDGQEASFRLYYKNGNSTQSLSSLPNGAGTYQLAIKHQNGNGLYGQDAIDSLGYITKKADNNNAELELKIPVSEMKRQNPSIDEKHFAKIEFYCSNLMYRRISAAGASTAPLYAAAVTLLLVPLASTRIIKGRKRKDGKRKQMVFPF